jgi:hypothetical protein
MLYVTDLFNLPKGKILMTQHNFTTMRTKTMSWYGVLEKYGLDFTQTEK